MASARTNDKVIRVFGLFLFVGFVLAALVLGQTARRSFPKSYATVNRIFLGIELLYSVLIAFAVLYFCLR
jgi:hypothetical protein